MRSMARFYDVPISLSNVLDRESTKGRISNKWYDDLTCQYGENVDRSMSRLDLILSRFTDEEMDRLVELELDIRQARPRYEYPSIEVEHDLDNLLIDKKNERYELLRRIVPESYNDYKALADIAAREVDYLKRNDLCEVGALDFYKFGFMPVELIDELLEVGGYGDETDRHTYELYFGWYKDGGDPSNTIIAMPGTSLLKGIFDGDIDMMSSVEEEDPDVDIEYLRGVLAKIEEISN